MYDCCIKLRPQFFCQLNRLLPVRIALFVGGGGPPGLGSGGGMYVKRRRPKSCKYDTYRLRSRTSVVEENLFGEPLKNRLMMSRSRSMEALEHSRSGESSPGDHCIVSLPNT